MLNPEFQFDLDHSNEDYSQFVETYRQRFSTLTGYGRFQTPIGTYVGTYQNGQLLGQAKFHSKKNILFEGIWQGPPAEIGSSLVEGKMTAFNGGLVYEGQFGPNETPLGEGVLVLKMGSGQEKVKRVYSGEFLVNQSEDVWFTVNGKGQSWRNEVLNNTLTGKISIRKDRDELNGAGRQEMPETIEISGNFKNGKLHGKGVIRMYEGDIIEGTFRNGKEHGVCTVTNNDGQTRSFEYVDGVKIGDVTFVSRESAYEELDGVFGILMDESGDEIESGVFDKKTGRFGKDKTGNPAAGRSAQNKKGETHQQTSDSGGRINIKRVCPSCGGRRRFYFWWNFPNEISHLRKKYYRICLDCMVGAQHDEKSQKEVDKLLADEASKRFLIRLFVGVILVLSLLAILSV